MTAKAKGKKSSGKPAGKTASEQRNVQKLDRRDMKLPRNFSGRTQDHGDEPVSALDVRVTFEISDAEACALAQEKYFTRGLFLSGGRGKPDRPLIPNLAIKLKTIETARVWFYLGPNGGGEWKLGVCKLKNPELTFGLGRKITVSALVQSTPSAHARIGDLFGRLSTGAQIRIEYEHNAEQADAFTDDSQAETSAQSQGDVKPDDDKEFEDAARAQVAAFSQGTPCEDSTSAETH